MTENFSIDQQQLQEIKRKWKQRMKTNSSSNKNHDKQIITNFDVEKGFNNLIDALKISNKPEDCEQQFNDVVLVMTKVAFSEVKEIENEQQEIISPEKIQKFENNKKKILKDLQQTIIVLAKLVDNYFEK